MSTSLRYVRALLICVYGSCLSVQKQYVWCPAEVYVIHHTSSVLGGWRGHWPFDSGTKSNVKITGFWYQAPLSHSGRLHINLCEKIIKGLVLSSQSLALKKHPHNHTAALTLTHIYMHRIKHRNNMYWHTAQIRDIDRSFNEVKNNVKRWVDNLTTRLSEQIKNVRIFL